MRPLAIDLFCGLFGWSEGLVQEGWRTVGFDLENMHAKFGLQRPPHCQLVIQDVRTLCGAQFKDAGLLVASPPCQKFSYFSMPWSKAKEQERLLLDDAEGRKKMTELFDTCFRIQREACEAAGHHIPMIVENVRGAQKWVGPARWNYGSFYLFGDVPALMPVTLRHSGVKAPGMNWSDQTKRGQIFTRLAGKRAQDGLKGAGGTWFGDYQAQKRMGYEESGIKCGGDWLNQSNPSISRQFSSKSPARKMASALIAKIPEPLSRHIARTFYPVANPRGPGTT